jgi:hypothetical protein
MSLRKSARRVVLALTESTRKEVRSARKLKQPELAKGQTEISVFAPFTR